MATATKMTYEEWFAAADARCSAKYGLSLLDLADVCYADWYEDGITPAEAVRLAIKNETG